MNMDKAIEERIKDAANIVDVVSDYTKLSKRGPNYIGLCPLHDDRSVGSFVVSPAKNICSCWSCCDKGLDPIDFIRKKEGCGYREALERLAKRYNIDTGNPNAEYTQSIRKELPPLQMIEIPKAIAARTIADREKDRLVKWLRLQNWDDLQRKRLEQALYLYAIGQWTTWKGETFTCFWQCDEEGRLRSGKLMSYKADGHRDKEAYPFTDDRGRQGFHSQDFVHSQMRKEFPPEKYEYKATLFGMHLIRRFPKATVNIVESEKTAIIMAISYGVNEKSVWMATGGMQFLKRELLQPLIEKKLDIILYPDKDGIEKWRERANLINYKRLKVETRTLLRCWIPDDGDKADIADIIIRMVNSRRRIEDSPVIQTFKAKLNLEDVQSHSHKG